VWSLLRDPTFWRSRFPGVVLLGTTGTIDGTASANAIVKICPGGPSTVAGGGGSFSLRNVPIGTYTIISYNPAMTQKASEEIEVTTNGTTSVTFSYSAATDCGCP